MTELAIGILGSPAGSGWFVMRGADQVEGLVSASYDPKFFDDQPIEETILLQLRGSRSQLRSVITKLEQLITAKQRSPQQELSLRIWSGEQLAYLYSRIIKARLELDVGQLESQMAGSFRCRLVITRESDFFGDEELLPLSNGSGGNLTDGVNVFNHDDAGIGHDNWFSIDTAALALSKPASIKLEVENNYIGLSLGDFFLGGMATTALENRSTLTLEAENGSGGTAFSSASASGGKYSQYSWTGTGWTSLSSWTIKPVELSQLRSRTFTPILRFFNPIADASLSLRLQVSQDDKVVWQSPHIEASAGVGYLPLEPIQLPLGSLPLVNYAYAHQISLHARNTSLGEHSFELDDLILLPQEPFLEFHNLAGLTDQSKLIIDGRLNQCWTLKDDLELKTHRKIGGDLQILPGNKHYFWLFLSDIYQRALIERTVRVRAWMRRRWSLP